MNPNDVILVLERIAEMLTPGAQQAWEIAVRQVAAEAMIHWRIMWAWIGGIIIGIVILAVGLWWNHKDDLGLGIVLAMFGFVGTAGSAIGAVYNSTTALAMGMNPDYYAINILMGLVGR